MGRAKLPRKSTNIDMTAMCDVAFLLLSFFILTTKFKPPEAIAVQTPSSVSAKAMEEKDFVMVTIDRNGKVFINMDDEAVKEKIAQSLNQTKNLGINVASFKKAEFFGCSLAQLNSFLQTPSEQRKGDALPGIPVDSTKGANEMVEWMSQIRYAYADKKLKHLYVKGDNESKYPSFKAVIDAFKKNDFLKFQMITTPEGLPPGTELWKSVQSGAKREE